jgi:zinc transport system substrate-binding protein
MNDKDLRLQINTLLFIMIVSTTKNIKIMRNLFLFCLFFLSLFATNSIKAASSDTRSHFVIVSVAPHKFFVEKIAGNTIKVGLMVPAGASSHTYEPTPRQMLQTSTADLWFQIGESFEPRASKALKSHNPNLKLVDLRKGVRLISSDSHQHNHSHAHGCSHPDCQDMHFWLSAREGKAQAKTIAEALIALYPENKALYEKNLQAFIAELEALDQEISSTLQNLNNRTILVSHPAYAYFARDYNLRQLSIEFEGRDPTPQQLTRLIQEARQAGAKTIFIQPQYNNKGAKLIANQLGARIVELDPYSERYEDVMRQIAQSFASQ